MSQYYKPSLPRSLYYAILQLFKDNETVRAVYDDNPVKFIEDAVREKILSYTIPELNKEKIKRELDKLTKEG